MYQETATEKENVAPVNSFHKALLEAKGQTDDFVPHQVKAEDQLIDDPGSVPAVVVQAPTAHEAMELDEEGEEEEEEEEEEMEENVVSEVLEVAQPRTDPSATSNEEETMAIKELSVIAEDDEERSRVSPQPPLFSNNDAMDIAVPVRNEEPVPAAPTLTRKPSTSQFAGLPAPSPLRKSMKLHREPSSSMLAPIQAHTPGTALTGGKRTSWLTKAKEVRALELTSTKKPEAHGDTLTVGVLAANKKRKSGEMLGPVDAVTDDETDRKQKSAKVVNPIGHPSVVPKDTSASDSPLESKPIKSFTNPTKPLQPSGSSTFVDDFTVPLADLSDEEGVLDKLKRTVEGFGARSKSMGKSLGGNAAAALAEARAAAQARVAERNKEEGAEVVVDPLSAQPPKRTSSESVVNKNTPPQRATERRLSVSDLISTTGSKDKGSAGHVGTHIADTSVSTTPPDSPRLPTRLSQAPAHAPVFSKPPPVFVAPSTAPASTVNAVAKDLSFKLPVGHPFALPPAMALGVNSGLATATTSKVHHPLSAQSSKASQDDRTCL